MHFQVWWYFTISMLDLDFMVYLTELKKVFSLTMQYFKHCGCSLNFCVSLLASNSFHSALIYLIDYLFKSTVVYWQHWLSIYAFEQAILLVTHQELRLHVDSDHQETTFWTSITTMKYLRLLWSHQVLWVPSFAISYGVHLHYCFFFRVHVFGFGFRII